MPSFMFCSQFEQFTYFDGLITCPTFFSFSLISRVLEKVLSEKSETNDYSYTKLANTSFLSYFVRDVTSTVRSSFNCGLESYRKFLEMEGISSNAAKLTFQSRRLSSIANYEFVWSKWTGCCCRGKFDPFCGALNKTVNCLSTFLGEGL